MQVRTGTATEKETMIEEERKEVKNKKAKRASQNASAADQRISWPPNAQFINLGPRLSIVNVNLITPHPNAGAIRDASPTILS